jgi:predicted Zn-dependent peptidase
MIARRAIQETKLDNGLTIVSDHVPTVESVSIGVWAGSGTRAERAAENGVAHLLEHMVFKGTGRRSALAIAEEIEAVGGHLNAYTSREVTGYYAKTLKADWGIALDLLADMLQGSVFDPVELDRERSVIVQEIGQSFDTPDDVIFDHFQEVAFPDQDLGRPVLGSAEIVSNVPRDAVVRFLQAHYNAENLVVAAAGAIEHAALVDAAARLFDSLPKSKTPPVARGVYRGGDFREAQDLEQVHWVLGFEGVSLEDPAYFDVSVLSMLFGGGMSSRLFQEVREKRGLAYTIHSFSQSYRDTGLFGIYAGTGEELVPELVPVVMDEIAGLADTLGPAEVERAKVQLKAGLLMGLESTASLAEHLGQSLATLKRQRTVEEIVGKIDQVTIPSVAAAARRIFGSGLTSAALGPIGKLEDHGRLRARLGLVCAPTPARAH